MVVEMASSIFRLLLAVTAVSATAIPSRDLTNSTTNSTSGDLASCPGYKAINVITTDTGITADLVLNGPACNTYGTDLANLTLSAVYETGMCFPALSIPTVDHHICICLNSI